MAVFAYDPQSAKEWANKVVEYLNGEGESVNACSKKFSEQIEKLVQPNVWTGAAASKNYQNFLETHQALITFVNNFGAAFEESMNSVNQSVANLEINSLGTDTNVSSTFGTLTYSQLSTLSEQNINKELVTYDYATITSISTALKQILTTLQTVNSNLTNKINELDNGSRIWDGNAAAEAKETLNNTLKTNMDKVFEALNICISNINTAAEAAQAADNA